jgi:hypothetical protein
MIGKVAHDSPHHHRRCEMVCKNSSRKESSIVALLTADEAARLATCLSSAQQEFPGGPPAFGGKAGIR